MPMKNIISTLSDKNRKRLGEVVRFGIVGVAATVLQYVAYILLAMLLPPAIANIIAYIISFVFNYIASTRYTFKVKSTKRRGAGFVFSHAVNLSLQTVLLQFFLWLGLDKNIALLPVFAICVPVNFLLVRCFLKKGS